MTSTAQRSPGSPPYARGGPSGVQCCRLHFTVHPRTHGEDCVG